MPRAILVQHHPGERTPLPLAAVRSTRLGAHQKALRLQKYLRPGVAPAELMVAHKVLVKMPGREPAVTTAVQGCDLFLSISRNPFARDTAKPAVQQTGVTALLKAYAPTPECPLGDPKQLSRFNLIEFARFIPTQNTPELDHPHTVESFRPAHRRSQMSKLSPDRSCAT
jgi:hypothetical protein